MKKFSFDINGGNYAVTVKSFEDNFAEIEVNGTPYSVKINKVAENTTKNLTAPAKPKPVLVTPSAAVKTAGKVKSPLPGSVLKVNVAVGQSFKEGDVLMVMESMKMENNILAECNGTITKVCAPAGTAVLQDEILFEYETAGTPVIVETKPQPAAVPVAAPAPKPAQAAPKGAKAIKSPLPGSVLKVNVAVGQSFKEDDVLMVMESMKMENNILAECNGTVTKVCAAAGSAVLQDEVLFEYE